jgi:predicted DsbA family dithiol-disulfide isomerase
MRVEIWSDVVCPWCYIGKRRFEKAMAEFDHADEVEVVWRSFELDPSAPARREGNYAERLARKYGGSVDQALARLAQLSALAADEGLDYHLDKVVPGNTFDAHRLLHLAAERGMQDALKEALLAAYFTESRAIGETATLAGVAVSVGLDPDEVAGVLASDAYAAAVRQDEADAASLDITGVPCFVIDRKFSIPGAMDPALILRALVRAWEETQAATTAGAEAG